MKNCLYTFIIINIALFSDSSDTLNVNYDFFKDDRLNNIVLYLEPFNISTFILNKYYPNNFVDYQDYGYTIDGSMHLPIYQNITEKIFFNVNENGTYSQLSYKQKKTDLYFDTKIALKSDINDLTTFLFKAESKSIYSNINQNYHLSFHKNTPKTKLIVSYLYHIQEDPSIDYYQDFNTTVESFHSGYDFSYYSNKIKFYSKSSWQFSNNKRFLNIDYLYDSQFLWSNNNVVYKINDTFNLLLRQSYKKYIIEHSNLSTYNDNRNFNSLTLNCTFLQGFNLSFGANLFAKDFNNIFSINYTKNKYSLSLISDNDVIDEMIIDNLNEPYIKYKLVRNSRFIFSINSDVNKLNITYGKADDKITDYKYYLLNGVLDFSVIDFDYKYYFYDSKTTNIKSYLGYGFTLSPIIKNKRFRPYGRIFGNYYTFNSNKILNLENISLFEERNNHKMDNLNLFNVEFGFMFDSFKISFVRLNPKDEEINVTEDIKFIRYDYIDLIWYFKD